MALFIPITKIDSAKRLVYGTLSEEIADKTGEILDYETAKPAFQAWTQEFFEASGGKSLGNVRAMHGAMAAGKLTDICFDDEHKRIEGVAKVVDDDAWNKVLEGVYTGFSIGGGYARRWPDPENPALMRYTPTLSEVSLVDNPAVPTALFTLVKQDAGTAEQVNDADDKANEETLKEALLWLKEQNPDDAVMGHIDALLDYLDEGESDAEKCLVNALQQMVAQLGKRLAELEAQPVAPRGVLKAVLKSEDYVYTQGKEAQSEASPAARAQALIKLALAQPQSVYPCR